MELRKLQRAARRAKAHGVSVYSFILRYNNLVDEWTITRELASIYYGV